MELLAAVDWVKIIAAFCFWFALVWAQHLDQSFPAWLRCAAWPALAVWLVADTVCDGPGLVPALAASPALVFALWLWVHGLRRFLSDDLAPLSRRLLEMMAATGPLVAATAWVWSRYNRTFAGFPDPLATLTTVHFAITFGVLPLAMAATERPLSPSRVRACGIWLYIAGASATALCFALRSNPSQPSGFEAICAALFAMGFLLWAARVPPSIGRVPFYFLVPGLLLGLAYTASLAFGWPSLTIPQMATIHGSLNLLGALWLAAQAPAFAGPTPPAPESYSPIAAGSPAEAIFRDAHRQDLGPWSPEAFERVKAALLAYRFYPDDVMVRRTQFEEEGRPVRVGDRLGLGLKLPNLPGLPPFMLPAIVEVDVVQETAQSVRFGYVTTERHYGRGQWLAEISRADDRAILAVTCHIRPARWYVWLGLPVYRRFQLAAFRAGLANLRALR